MRPHDIALTNCRYAARDPMKIVFTVAALTPESGGPARTVSALSSSLADLGIAAEIITLAAGRRPDAPLMPANKNVKTVFVPCWKAPRFGVALAPAFGSTLRRRCAPDACLIHDNGAWLATNHAAAKVAREQKKTLVLSPRGMLTKWSLEYKSCKKRLAMFAYQRRDLETVSCFHASSEQEAGDLRSLGLTQPIAIIPNGVKIPLKTLIHREKDNTRTVLFLSRINPKKGLLNLVKAWAIIRPEGWRAVIAGPDEQNHKKAVIAAIRHEGLERQFAFTGMIPDEDKWRVFSNADLFVLPSYSENFGVAVAEALACGVPVITTKGAPWEMLPEKKCGWWIDIGAMPLAAALKEALSMSDGKRVAMGLRGRKLVMENFAWDTAAKQMTDVYHWLSGQAEKPGCIV